MGSRVPSTTRSTADLKQELSELRLESVRYDLEGIRRAKLSTTDINEAKAAGANALHPPFIGSHLHVHSAFGTQGDDLTHQHAHTHLGDAGHDHHDEDDE